MGLFDVKDPSLAAAGRRRVEWAEQEMPVLRQIRARFAEEQPLQGLTIGASRRYDGPFGKSDRAFLFGLLGLLLGAGARIERAIPFLLCGMILLLACTSVNRARGALRESALKGGVR